MSESPPDDSPKRRRGRPSTDSVEVTFTLPAPAAEYLTALGKRYGWGDSIHAVCKAFAMSRCIELQTSGFHEKAMPHDVDKT